MDILMPIFLMKGMVETWCDKPCCDIPMVAACVTKEKELGRMAQRDNEWQTVHITEQRSSRVSSGLSKQLGQVRSHAKN